MKKQLLLGLAAALAVSSAHASRSYGPAADVVADGGVSLFASEINTSGGVVFANSQISPTTEPNDILDVTAIGNLGNITLLVPSIQGLGNGENTRLRIELIGSGATVPEFRDFSQNNVVVYGFNPGDTADYRDQRPEATTTTRQCRANTSINTDPNVRILDINCEEGINITDIFAVTFNVYLTEEQTVSARVSRHFTVADAQADTNDFFNGTLPIIDFVPVVSYTGPEKLHPVEYINPGDESAVDTEQDPLEGVRNSFMFGNEAGIFADGGDDAEQADNTPISEDVSFDLVPGVYWNTSEFVVDQPQYILGDGFTGGAEFVVWGDMTNIDDDGINIDNNGSNPDGTSIDATFMFPNRAIFSNIQIDTSMGLQPLSFELNPEGLPTDLDPGFFGPINPSAYHLDASLLPVANGGLAGVTDPALDTTNTSANPTNEQAAAPSDFLEFQREFMSEIELGGAVDQANYVLRATNREVDSPFLTFIRITNDTNCPADIYVRMIDDNGESSYFDLGDVRNQSITLDAYASTSVINADRLYEAAEAAALANGYAFDADTAKARLEIVSTYAHSTETRPNAFNGSGATSHFGEQDNATAGTEDDYTAAQAALEGFPAVDVQVITRSSDSTTFTYADTQD